MSNNELNSQGTQKVFGGDKVFLCCLGWPGTCNVVQDSLNYHPPSVSGVLGLQHSSSPQKNIFHNVSLMVSIGYNVHVYFPSQ